VRGVWVECVYGIKEIPLRLASRGHHTGRDNMICMNSVQIMSNEEVKSHNETDTGVGISLEEAVDDLAWRAV
jgi:hypothetical protein